MPGETLAIIGRQRRRQVRDSGPHHGFPQAGQRPGDRAHADITDVAEAELRRIRKKVTMVFQSGALFDSLTVGENILFSLELRDDYNEAK